MFKATQAPFLSCFRDRKQVYAYSLKISRLCDTMYFKWKEEIAMAVTYKKLFHILIDRSITNAELIEKICKTLNCGVDDILEFTDEEK